MISLFYFLSCSKIIFQNTTKSIQDANGSNSNWTPWNYSGNGEYFTTDFNNANDHANILEVDLATIQGPAVGNTITSSKSATFITVTIGQYSVVRGHSVQVPPTNCNNICSAISNIAGFSWETLGNLRATRNTKPDFITAN